MPPEVSHNATYNVDCDVMIVQYAIYLVPFTMRKVVFVAAVVSYSTEYSMQSSPIYHEESSFCGCCGELQYRVQYAI